MADTAGEDWITKYDYQFSEGKRSKGKHYRIFKQNDQILTEENIMPKSKYRLYFKRIGWVSNFYMRDQFIVEELTTEEILATNTQIAFNGGWAERFLAQFSDAGGGGVAWCTNTEQNTLKRIDNLIITTLKNKGV